MRDCEERAPDFFGGLKSYAKQNKLPFSAAFELTPHCNFRCVMCYVRLSADEARMQGKLLPADEWIKAARQAKEMGTLMLTLTGGEPFLHPEFWEIYRELNSMGFLISVLSNGYAIDDAVMDRFREYGMPYSMKLTLYGASDETYRRVCGVTDGFTRVSDGVKRILDAGIPLKMTSTIVRENACDLQEIYRFARERAIPMQHTVSVVRSARGAENTADESRFDFAYFSDELTLDALEKSKFPPLSSPFAWCGSYETSFWMTWHGHIQLCAFMNAPFVQWSGDLGHDWRNLLGKLEAIRSPKECADCKWQKFCQRCPGILCGESGDPEKISDSLCRTAKRLCEIYEIKKKEEIQ